MILKQHRITIVALVLVIAAMFAAPASARPIGEVGPTSEPASSPTPFGTEQAATGATTPTDVRIASSQQPQVGSVNAIVPPQSAETATLAPSSGAGQGFDWADAGIGAGAAFALTMMGLGGALVVNSRRHREARQRATA